jgi:hypothetical protein
VNTFQWTPRLQLSLLHRRCWPRRGYTSTEKNTIAVQVNKPPGQALDQATFHQPPLPVRVALASATTALATPIFPAIGFVNLFLRVVLPDPHLRATVSTSIGTVLSFATWTLVPTLYNVAPILLPCAIGNGIVAGATYAVVDVASGGPTSWVLRRNPLAAGAIGAVTGFVAPYFLYGPVCFVLYGMEGVTESTRFLLSFPLATQVTMATGFVAGVSMFPLLYFPMNGIPGVHWMNFSGPALLATALALWYVYSPDDRMILPVGSFLDPQQIPLLDTIARYNVSTDELEAYSISSKKWIGPVDVRDVGQQLASTLRQNKDPVFDDRIVAWLDCYTFMDAAVKYPDRVVTVPDEKSIREKEHSMLVVDGVVAFILARSKAADQKVNSNPSSTRERLVEVVHRIKQTQISRKGDTFVRDTVILIETLSVAVELLLLLQQNGDQSEFGETLNEILNESIQRSNLGLVVFTADEKVPGESIESQLRFQAWKQGGPVGFAVAMAEWNRISDEDKERRWNQRIFRVGTVLLSIGGMVLLNYHG